MKSNYAPLVLSMIVCQQPDAGGVCFKQVALALNPTDVRSIRPYDDSGKMRVGHAGQTWEASTVQMRDAVTYYVRGLCQDVVDAWHKALRGE